MFRKVLIANRGEIACRIAATLREMSIASVAVCSEVDRGALHTREADEVVEIAPAAGTAPAAGPAAAAGTGPASGSSAAGYLDAAALIRAARERGAEAIHPGYGFLAENAEFAAAVEAEGLAFIGPTPDQIRAMGDKRAARDLATRAKLPVVPGAIGNTRDELAAAAQKLGYPVLVKAALGGGGKGMRVVHDPAGLAEALESAARIARSAFGDDTVYLEKRLERPRHIEVQVMGDGRGGAIHLFERECSLQRRHQKVIEESPSPAVNETLRERLTYAAVALAQAVRYRGAGTVEFLVGEGGAFHFLEMNTRLQVEHPVTELVTGRDLVRLQLEVAAGGTLPAQLAIGLRGHAIEARVYAEDATRDFLPQSGEMVRAAWPRAPFVRVDRGIESGDGIPVQYDPMLAKVVACAEHRERALERLAHALDQTRLHGVITNLPFLKALVRSEGVRSGAFDTEWIEREFMSGFEAVAAAPVPEAVLAAAALAEALGAHLADVPGGAPGAASDGAPGNPFAELGRWRLPGTE
jgi:acetyl/propionyl-CoA carboxylase alpha subunit